MSAVTKRIAKELGEEYGTDGEWWKRDTGDTISKVAAKMLAHGIAEDEVKDLIGSIVGAIGGEYGN